jgi:asparagine synthase (glutamine-hydrolysing)
MCGITGYLRLNSRQSSLPDLQAMTRVIAHRGPDEDGFYTDARVGLGMRRLSIIDLAGGKQPMMNERGDLHLIHNGEIYNYRELRAELSARGHVFKTNSDTETIVHGYEDVGRCGGESLARYVCVRALGRAA